MYKTLGGLAAAAVLAVIAVPGTAAAQRQEPGIHKQVAGEEFSSQRRRYYRRYYARRYYAPRYRYYGYGGYGGPGYYGYGYPYYYQPYYARPYVGFGIGPFGFWW